MESSQNREEIVIFMDSQKNEEDLSLILSKKIFTIYADNKRDDG